MVGYSRYNEALNQFDFMLAGGLSGFITRAFCQPLDVLKIRFQLQVEPISDHHISKYRSILQAVNLISKEEGLKAFWKGHVPAQWLSVIYGTTQFWTFEVLSRSAHHITENWAPLVNFSCGYIAGGAATLTSFPFDVVRTRLVAQGHPKLIYRGTLHAVRDICVKEHPLVLYRGLLPTVLQVGPHAGVQFACYKVFVEAYSNLMKNENVTLTSSIVSGSLAGLVAKTTVYPFDLAKKRMQIQGFEENRKHFGKIFRCKGFIDCFVKIYEMEGIPGYFKGLSPSLIKAIVATALHFSSYEMICKALVHYKSEE